MAFILYFPSEATLGVQTGNFNRAEYSTIYETPDFDQAPKQIYNSHTPSAVAGEEGGAESTTVEELQLQIEYLQQQLQNSIAERDPMMIHAASSH